MSDWTFTITVSEWVWWVLIGYHVVGLLLVPPLAVLAGRQVTPTSTARASLRDLAKHPLHAIAAAFAWPVAAWQVINESPAMARRRHRRAEDRCWLRDHERDGHSIPRRRPCLSCWAEARRPWWRRMRVGSRR